MTGEIKVVQFHPRHIEVMELRDIEQQAVFKLKDAYDRIEKIAKDSVQAVTFLYDGRVLFCAGFNELWPGVFDVWMISSIYIPTVPILVARMLRQYMDRIMEDFGAKRLQTTTHDDEMHVRFMEFLGFNNDTPGGMKNFAPDGKTMLMFSRTR